MISDLWTLEPAADPSAALPLADLGVSEATLSRANQAAATLSLTLPVADAAASMDAWPWESRWLLRRDGEPVWRGRVATVPRAASSSESIRIELRDAWWDLERTPYLQDWRSLTAAGTAIRAIPRALLGVAPEGRQTTSQALAQVLAAASAAGTSVTLAPRLPDLVFPPLEASNQSCAELIRAILRWHPGACAAIVPVGSADVLRVVDRSLASTWAIPVAGLPVGSWRVASRPDLQVDAVHVHYGTEADEWSELPADEGETPGLVSRRRLVVFSDIWPPASAVTRRTMTVDLPSTPNGGGGGQASPPPLPHRAPVKTRPLPPSGAFDTGAEKWWLDMLAWTSLGLTVDDIRLPRATTDTVQMHRVRFAWEVDDPDDPLQAPSAINPESTPLWRPPSVGDLPRMLTGGQIAEWMRVRASEVVVDATVGVRKSTVDALPERPRAIFMALAPRVGSILGVPAYLVDREVRVMGTNAKTKVYTDWVGAQGGAAQNQAGSVGAAEEAAVIPGLARALFDERQALPWEGSVELVEEEVGTHYLRLPGSVVSLVGGRPEWASMRAVLQGWRADLAAGSTSVEFGPPEHLSPQDRLELHMAARRARRERAEAAQAPLPPAAGPVDDDVEETFGAVYPPTVAPLNVPTMLGGGAPGEAGPWGLQPAANPGDFTIDVGSILLDLADATSAATIASAGSTFTGAVGHIVRIRLEPSTPGSLADLVVTLESAGQWTGYPLPRIDGSGDGVEWVASYYPLWRLVAEGSPGSIALAEGIHAIRLAPPCHLGVVHSVYAATGDRPVPVPVLVPAPAAIPAS